MCARAAGLSRHGLVLWMLCGLAAPSWAAEGTPPLPAVASEADRPLDFDIPAQPLAAALNRYADISGQPALFPSDAVEGRESSVVRGRYTDEAALHLLLQGTGLVAEKRDSDLGRTFVLRQAGSATAASVPRVALADLFSEEGYPGLVQARIWQALCADARTAPGRYSAVLRFLLDAEGRVRGAQLLASSGDARRDAALLETVERVQVEGRPPAAAMQGPLTMAVLPNAAATGPRCGQAHEKAAS